MGKFNARKRFGDFNFHIMERLNQLGVQEMNSYEMKTIEGGWIGPLLLGALIGAFLTQDLDDLGAAFREGWNDAARN